MYRIWALINLIINSAFDPIREVVISQKCYSVPTLNHIYFMNRYIAPSNNSGSLVVQKTVIVALEAFLF